MAGIVTYTGAQLIKQARELVSISISIVRLQSFFLLHYFVFCMTTFPCFLHMILFVSYFYIKYDTSYDTISYEIL